VSELIDIASATGFLRGLEGGVDRWTSIHEGKFMKTLKALLLCGGLMAEELLGGGVALAADGGQTAGNAGPRQSRQTESTIISVAAEKALTITPNAHKRDLRLGFSAAPLSVVLDYFSRAAGLIIVQETPVEGPMEVLSQAPVDLEEAISVLNASLAVKGAAALRQGRTLFIVKREEAKRRDIPVHQGNDPEVILRTSDLVTQIIPVHYAEATQLTRDLQPLLPVYASLTANESGNALVLTAAQADVRRMMLIVRALDTAISSISTLRIIPLQNADAKELASVIKELFPAPDTSNRNNANGANNSPPSEFAGGPPGLEGGGIPGPDPGGPLADASGPALNQTTNRAASGSGRSEARQAAYRVIAVADERTNALLVSAPDDLLNTIERLVKEIDTRAEQVTEVRLFRLRNADPEEMADLLSDLFSSNTRTDTSRSDFQWGGGPMGPALETSTTPAATSQRAQQKGTVLAVSDPRTASLLVSAARDLMPQIEKIVAELDANPAHQQKVYVYALENANTSAVQQVLRDMFQTQNSSVDNSQSTTDPLLARQSQTSQSSGQLSLGNSFGNSTGARQNAGGN
jgi:type II secretory pathway component GspD/PulD (secretin)